MYIHIYIYICRCRYMFISVWSISTWLTWRSASDSFLCRSADSSLARRTCPGEPRS